MTIADGFNFGVGLLMALASSVLCAVVMFYGSAFVIALYRTVLGRTK